MANSTISALTSATTPLAGTETLPVVQSGSTKQVSVANLTYGRDVSTRSILVRSDSGPTTYYGTISHDAVTTGANIYDVTSASGGGHVFRRGGSTLVSIDAGGNIIPAVAGKGVNFTANTPASGMTSQNLTWYEEGTWTPTVTASTPGITPPTFTSTSGTYTRIGRTVYITYNIQFNQNGTGAGYLKVVGLPFNLGQRGFGVGQEVAVVGFNTISNGIASTNYFYLTNFAGAYPGGTSYNLLGSFTYTL